MREFEMNKELISKLRKQSKVDPKEIVRALANTNDAKVVEHWLEQFAEQIVRECADAIINDERLNDVRSAANGCVRTIKEHFGVEECLKKN
jgi:hypothetical protein